MAWEQVNESLEFAQAAGADLRGKLHLLCKFDTSGNIVLAAAASDLILGVIREDGNTAQPVTVQFGGVAKVMTGAAVTRGDLLTSDGNGKAITTTSAGNRIIGIALASAGATDIIIPVMMVPSAV